VNFFYLLYDAALLWIERGAGYFAAAFSYYAPLALVPLLLFSVTVAGFFYGETFTSEVFTDWGSVLGEDLLTLIRIALENLSTETKTSQVPLVASAFFLGFYIIALNVLSDGFLRLWRREQRGLKYFFKKSARAIGFLLVLQIYLVLVVGFEFFIVPTLAGVYTLINTLFLYVSTAAFFTFLYRFLTNRAPSWAACMVGALVSSLLFVLIKSLVDIYIATTPVLSLYGAAGLILILFVWVYVLAVIIFYGAAVVSVYDKIVVVPPRVNSTSKV
jgi:membrane protein